MTAKAPEKHMNCLREWLKDEREDQQHTFEPNEFAYRQGRIDAFELAIELLTGKILDSDQEG